MAESQMYSLLAGSGENSITSFYGAFSYEETQKRFLVLEYAKGGSLLDYFRNVSPPVLPGEFEMLWRRLLDLLDGLHTLHNLNTGRGFGDSQIAG